MASRIKRGITESFFKPKAKKLTKQPRTMKRTRLRHTSLKRERDNVVYSIAKAEWKNKRESEDGFHRCEFKHCLEVPSTNFDMTGRCMAPAMAPPHHRKGRGRFLTNKSYFMALCFPHHSYVELNKRWARKHKYILYK